MGLAYLLDPLVMRLQKLGINRTFATIIILLFAIGLIALALVLLIPALSSAIGRLRSERCPDISTRSSRLIEAQSQTWLGQLAAEKLPEAQKSLSGLAGQAAGWVASLLGSILAGGRALLSALSLIVLAPVIAFYPAARLGPDGRQDRRMDCRGRIAKRCKGCCARWTA